MVRIEQFRNAILCEDVREEIGNKKSLVGVFGGDVLVAHFPAQIKVAFYVEYLPGADDTSELNFELMLGGIQAAHGALAIPPDRKDTVTMVIPQGFIRMEKPGDIVLQVGVGSEMIEVLRKKVYLADEGSIPAS